MTTVHRQVAAAYSSAGEAWASGPAAVYRRMAEALVDRCPGGVDGRVVLDLGAGTGVAGVVAVDAGAARVIAVDAAFGMLARDRARRPPAAVGDARALPFAPASFGAVVAAFSLNHLDDPAVGLREAFRVLAPGGGLVAGAYAADDGHPVKAAVEAAAAALGWVAPPWYEWMRRSATPALASVAAARAALAEAGIAGAAIRLELAVVELGPADLVAWRLGMAQLAPWVETLFPATRERLAADALDRLGADPAPLVRTVIVLTASKPDTSRR